MKRDRIMKIVVRHLAVCVWKPSIARLAAVLLMLAMPFVAMGHAAPIRYTLTIVGNPVLGDQGPTGWGILANGDQYFFYDTEFYLYFDGDTDNVISFTSPVQGSEILVGTASFKMVDANTGDTLREGTFLPTAGIFVSVDNVNHGIGFGSSGTTPGSANFPGQPAYPYAMSSTIRSVVSVLSTYDLRSSVGTVDILPGTGVSCVGFPTPPPCGFPIGLPTTAGLLHFWPDPDAIAIFSAELNPPTHHGHH